MRKRIIVTGGAGFIGSNLCDFLLKEEWEVTCIDNFDDYYSPEIKRRNILNALKSQNFTLIESDIQDINYIQTKLEGSFDAIIHLAAKAGVRYSINHPEEYFSNNVEGTKSVCKLAKRFNISKIIFSSSSSVYGNNPNIPWNEKLKLMPLSPYAESKVISEQILQDFSKATNTQVVALRLFSVYGPRMRPDLMMSKILNNITLGTQITVFGDGSSERDYTYVDDIVEGIYSSMNNNTEIFDVINLGNKRPIRLTEIINKLSSLIRKTPIISYTKIIEGEPECTFADISKAEKHLTYKPKTNIETGIAKFYFWKTLNK